MPGKRIKGGRKLLFGGLILLAFLLRAYRFGDIPHGVNRDEASIGYTAKLLSETGKEEHGRGYPLKFESFGDWKMPVYIYLSIPFIKFSGLNTSSVRMASLISALMMMAAAYGLAKKAVDHQAGWRISGIMALIFLTVNPWHFHFSRMGLEAMLAASFMSLSMWLLTQKGLRRQALGFILLGLTLFTYHAALVYVPLWLAGFCFFFRENLSMPKFRLMAIAFLIFWVGVMVQAWRSPEQDKATGTTIFGMNNEQKWEQIYQYRNGTLTSKLRYNQYTNFAAKLTQNYFKNFSPKFLFLRGGDHPHYNVPGYGNFFPIEIVMALVGVVFVFRTRNKLGGLLVFSWFLAAVPAALTQAGAHSTRSIFMLPYVQVLAGLGCGFIVEIVKTARQKKLILAIILIMIVVPAVSFFRLYFKDYRVLSDKIFDGYFKEISYYLQTIPPTQKVYLTYPFESPYIFYAFYNNLDSKTFFETIDYYPVDSLGFKYAKNLGNQEYIPNVRTLTESQIPIGNSLILSRKAEAIPGVQLKTFNNLAGEAEIAVSQIPGQK